MSIQSIRLQAIRAYQVDRILRRHPEIRPFSTGSLPPRTAAVADSSEFSIQARARLAAVATKRLRPPLAEVLLNLRRSASVFDTRI